MINAGKYCQPRKLTKIIGGILSIDSINIDNIKEYMNLFKSIDLGCAIKNHSFLVNRETEITLLHASGEETVLAFFYIILDELYKLGTVAGSDIRSYANATLDNFKFNIDKE